VRPVQAGSSLAGNRLSRRTPWILLGSSFAASFALFALLAAASDAEFSLVGAVLVGVIGYLAIITIMAGLIEGRRQALDRLITGLVTGAFALAMVPLISVGITVVTNGVA